MGGSYGSRYGYSGPLVSRREGLAVALFPDEPVSGTDPRCFREGRGAGKSNPPGVT